MNQGIRIKVVSEPDDDELYQFQIRVSNGDTSTSLEFWGYADNFRDFGNRLTNFPNGSDDIVTYELGEDEKDKFAYYMLLQVSCIDNSGRSSLKVVVDNHADGSRHQRSEFHIESMPADLNRLGQKLKEWSPDKVKELIWD